MTLRASLIATTVLAACVSAGPQDALAPAAVPGDWAAVSAQLSESVTPVTANWLEELGDPAVTDLAAEAIAYNNDLAASAGRVRAVFAQARIQRAGLLPTLGFSVNGNSQFSSGGDVILVPDPQTGQPVPQVVTAASQDQYSTAFSTTWDLDVWGRILDGTRAAYADAAAQELDYAAAALSITGGAAQTYYGLIEARLQRELGERDVETGEANLRIIERRYERGLSSSLDVRLARASLAQSRAQLIARQQAEREAARRLEVLVGRYPAGTIASSGDLPEVAALTIENEAMIGLGDPAALLFRRPDVLSSELALKAAGLRVSEARKALLPALSVNARAVDNFDNSGDLFKTVFDPDAIFATMAANLFQPLFQGGRIKANIKAQRARQEAAVYTYAQTALTAFREVEDAVAADTFLAAQLAARRLAFEEAAAAEELTERQYLSGTANIFDLISAQQRRIANESQFIAASRARLVNRIDLYLALGAPFSVPEFVREGGERFTPPSRDPDLAVAPEREGDA